LTILQYLTTQEAYTQNPRIFLSQIDKSLKTTGRGKYVQYTAELRAEIGRYAALHGNAAAIKHFDGCLDKKLSESTVRSMRDKYLGTYHTFLKVHKNENFFGFDFEFCIFS
jgi:hypothetical protein